MPVKEKPRNNKETWLDGLPDRLREMPADALFTREEILDMLRDRSVDVNEVTLVFWEKSGILPRPLRRWRDGAPRALYPPWAVDAIAHLRDLQGQGRTLEQIAPLMQSWKLSPIVWGDPVGPALTDARTALLAYAQGIGLDVLRIEGITIRFNEETDRAMHETALTVPLELRQSIVRRQSGG
jgi:DNA-binding transcriptional MerR regulator